MGARIEREITRFIELAEWYGYKVDVERHTSDYGNDYATITAERVTDSLAWAKLWLSFRTNGRGKFIGGHVADLLSRNPNFKTYRDARIALAVHAPVRPDLDDLRKEV